MTILKEQKRAEAAAVKAAKAAGVLMRQYLRAPKRVNSSTQYDVKLELDVRCQKLIERILHSSFPHAAVLGEEGVAGDPNAELRWVVDPIDGTVNFAYGIPHACVSIAFQRLKRPASKSKPGNEDYQTIVGVVYDPFSDELWTAIRGRPAYLNGQVIHVSRRRELRECIVSLGFAKSKVNLNLTLPYFTRVVRKIRKIRLMGAAALGMTYVASGRFDAYIERGIMIWDIAAGGLILECAGGEFWREPTGVPNTYRMVATNGLLRKKLAVPKHF
jgi:myo-inositol-1(or 4)-monophosphatase